MSSVLLSDTMMLKKYRKLPLTITAFQFDRDEVLKNNVDFMYPDGLPKDKTMTIYLFGVYVLVSWEFDRLIFEIDTLEGMMKINDKDYIIKGIKDEYYPCAEDIFENSYEEVV